MELEKIPSLIAAATFAALSFVVAYEWGYFGVIGSEFQSLFTAYDYISDLIVSIGPVLLGLMAVAAIYTAINRKSNFASHDGGFESTWGKRLWNWQLELIWGFGFVLALLFSDETHRSGLFVLFGLLWFRIVGYIYSHTAFDAFKNSASGLLVLIIPGAMITMYGTGRDAAYFDLKNSKDQYRLQAKNKVSSQSVKILRFLDKGAIVLNPETKTVEFHPREDIALLERDVPRWETRSFACRHWGWGCVHATSSSK
ncbi:MAG: hypothetical protein QOJ84_3985 [Bradyrhizobium sp.]|jgi:hypothetical protein|nr:hypothetical protein [Bradyrhizobium sp.]